MNDIYKLIYALKQTNPDALFEQLLKSNPQFAQFVSCNKNKSPKQIASDYGVDISFLNGIIN